METLVSSDSVLGKQSMFKHCMVVGVKFLGVGAIGLFSCEKRFPESSAKSLKIPDQAQTQKGGLGLATGFVLEFSEGQVLGSQKASVAWLWGQPSPRTSCP